MLFQYLLGKTAETVQTFGKLHSGKFLRVIQHVAISFICLFKINSYPNNYRRHSVMHTFIRKLHLLASSVCIGITAITPLATLQFLVFQMNIILLFHFIFFDL